MNSMKMLLVVLAIGALVPNALGDQRNPLAYTRERPAPFHPLGSMFSKKSYFRGNEKIGERIFYNNGKIAEEILFRRGKRHGLMRQFYENGKLFSTWPYIDGKLDGVVRFYKENGEILGESKFDHGTGVLRQYPMVSLGLLDREVSYKDGVLNGTVREWGRFGGKDNGCSAVQYVNGIEEGWSVTVNQDGSVLSSAYLHQGRMCGVYRRFSSGDKLEKGYPKFFIDGKEVAKAVYRVASKTDSILLKSLNDDGVAWGKKVCAQNRS